MTRRGDRIADVSRGDWLVAVREEMLLASRSRRHPQKPSHFCSIALPCYPRENAKRSLKSHQSQARIINRSIVSVLVGQQDTMSTEVFGSECGLDLMRTMKMSLATCVISKLNTSSSSGKNSSSYCACLELVIVVSLQERPRRSNRINSWTHLQHVDIADDSFFLQEALTNGSAPWYEDDGVGVGCDGRICLVGFNLICKFRG
jgi:hypothetical protein